jgi:uncharacterized membrane protein
VGPPTRSAIKPRCREAKNMNTKLISLSAVIAALYAALVIILAPISYGPVQLRVADCLIPLSALFGLPAVIGVTLGAFVSGWFLNPLDMVLGSVANLVASYIIFRFRNRVVAATMLASLVIGVIVGGYLWLFFPPPSILGLQLPFWLAMIISITLSSFIAVTVLGLTLLKVLSRSRYIKQLR